LFDGFIPGWNWAELKIKNKKIQELGEFDQKSWLT